jgi:hypothetical protein
MPDWPYGEPFIFGEVSMRKNSVQCDACCKAHPVEDEYDVSNLPASWYTVVPGQGGGFRETMHFCSTKCLGDWAKVDHDDTIAQTILRWIERGQIDAANGICETYAVDRLSVLMDDIEQLCRKES